MGKKATSSLSSISSWWNGLSDDVKRDIIVTAAGTATGASVGAAVNGWRGAAVGAPVAGGASYVGSHYAVPMVINLLNSRKLARIDQSADKGLKASYIPGVGNSGALHADTKDLDEVAQGTVLRQGMSDRLKSSWPYGI